jgi:hypothetical protein
MSAPPPPALPVRPVSDLDPRPVEWLWPGRLAVGKLAMLDGDPGMGKSFVTLDLCARLSTGHPWPDGSASPGAWPSLVLQAEDDHHDTLRPRLQALGADMARVFSPDGDDPLAAAPLRLPSGLPALDGALARTGARLLVLDPLTAFLDPGVCTNYEPSVRRALDPLARLAEARRCAVAMVRHLNKLAGGRALYRGGGSISLIATCRSAWLVAADLEAPGEATGAGRPGRRVMAQVKNNLGPPQPSLAYEVRTADGAAPALAWLGVSPWSADDLLASRRPAAPAEARDAARGFLAAALADGPLTSEQLWEQIADHGLSKRTLYRARKGLKITIIRRFRDRRPVSYWLLPHQELPADAPRDPEIDAIDESLRRMAKEFPPANPLDEL